VFFLTYKVTDTSRIVEFVQKACNIIAESRYRRPMNTQQARTAMSDTLSTPMVMEDGLTLSPPRLHIESIIRKMLNAAPIV
jgi:hypothetical protein